MSGDDWKQQKAWAPGKGDADFEAAMRASMVSAGATGNTLSGSGGGSSDAVDPMVAQLEAMGFERAQCEKALVATNHKGVEPAMEWILSHPDGGDDGGAAAPAGGGSSGGGASGIPDAATLPSIRTAKPGYKDGEISMFNKDGQAFAYKWSARNDDWECIGEVAGTGPSGGGNTLGGSPGKGAPAGDDASGDGTEATGEAKPELSMEERKAAMEKRIMEAKALKAEKAKQEQLEEEKKRRAMGKEAIESKEAREKMARERDIAERKREKENDKLAKEKILKKIAAEKEARKRKAAGEPAEEAAAPAQAEAKPAAAKKEHTSCVIMLKMLDGGSQKISFKPEETIGDVHLHVANLCMSGQMDGWALVSPFPREVFTQEKHSTTLKAAGLVPKAQLMVTKL